MRDEAEVGMDVRWIEDGSSRRVRLPELAGLLERAGGFAWIDVPPRDPDGVAKLADLLGFHPHAVQDALRRNPAPKAHVYADHVFLVLHAPEAGKGGHVHYVELDLFLSERYLVTVHGPLNPAVDPRVALVETGAVEARIESGRWMPDSTTDLAHAVLNQLIRTMTTRVTTLTQDTWKLEQTVSAGHLGNPQEFLEEMFRVRHGLQVVRTMADLAEDVLQRLGRIAPTDEDGTRRLEDVTDQFGRLQKLARAQTEYLEGVITLYRTRADTRMAIAGERLAVIAAVTLPVTAVSSIMGMNVIVNDSTHFEALTLLLLLMGTMSAVLLIWSRRQGWW